MTPEQWRASLAPKVIGTRVLVDSLLSDGLQPSLDFLIMTTSIAGVLGQPTESNYAAGNAFQDHFVSYCRGRGIPATSVAFGAIRDVGFLAENPAAAKILRKQGLTPMSEDEMLRAVDIAISDLQARRPWTSDSWSTGEGNIITGLQKQTNQTHVRHLVRDPRAATFAAKIAGEAAFTGVASLSGSGADDVPYEVKAAHKQADKSALRQAVHMAVAQRLAKLLQMPADRIQEHTKLMDLGMDSMLAVEVRQACTLGRDVSLNELMTHTATVGDLVSRVSREVERMPA